MLRRSAERVRCADLRIAQIESDVDRRGIPICVIASDIEQQLVAAVGVDVIGRVERIALTFGGIRFHGMNLIGDRLVEEELRYELIRVPIRACGANHKVNVDCPARIPTGIDRYELHLACRIGKLETAQELLP